MIWRVEVKNKPGIFDAAGEGIKKDILDLNIKQVEEVGVIDIYNIEGKITASEIRRICEELLTDPITQEYRYDGSFETKGRGDVHALEVCYKPGVMDPVEDSTKKGIRDLGIPGVNSIKTARKYLIKGGIAQEQVNYIGDKLLYNKVIQHISDAKKEAADLKIEKGEVAPYKFRLINVDMLEMDDKALLALSAKGQLFLNLNEMRTIRDYFKKLGKPPTDCELETIAQTWSEHCKHKTFRGAVEYKEIKKTGPSTRIYNNLLKETIMKVTRELKKSWCVSVFKDNSGVIKFNPKFNVCFKVETHNHPSALEPYGGAGTGTGGVIRDPLGTGRGARPILNTDVFCFGPPDYPHEKLPKGVLHPKRIMKGVVAGVRDYGNRMGIPTANGAVLFDERYIGNPLVFCGNVGLIPKDRSTKKVESGDLVLLVGGRTGRDGIHGATFSSGELTAESETRSGSAVQIGNPITEKKVTDTLLKARDRNLFDAITDCGGGGLSSAVGEMGEETGVRVYLEKIPLKYKGLTYTEIWISEAQERMLLAVDKSKIDAILEVFRKEDVEATVIGEFTKTKRLELFYNRKKVCDLDMRFLHNGLPKIKRTALWEPPDLKEPQIQAEKQSTLPLMKILSSLNVASKEWIIRQYDHEVQGASALKPLVGAENDGPSDACIVKPILDSKKAVIVSNGINPMYGLIDPYWMAASAIDEALRQIIAVGGSLKEVALLDNFCWGNTDKPDRLGGLVRAAQGCYDVAKAYGVPFISGKDSLNNEYTVDGKSIAIPGTLLISAMAVMDDVSKAVSMDLKKPGDLIFAVGATYNEMGGSHYYHINGEVGKNVPKVNAKSGKAVMRKLSKAVNRGLVSACHDCSEGGIAVACAEMAFAGGLGMEMRVDKVPYKGHKRNDILLFSESNTRFIVEVPRKLKKKFRKAMKGAPIGLIGEVTKEERFRVTGIDGKSAVIDAGLKELKDAWQRPFKGF
ncbi:MAG: phosphoribosylformylglycinamidine synthase subunit PurL [Candidatus Omnitrophica bacterium]|nr:phosphoribosylformylglycinamidine synthase subunit PurL [Candidatus Omnitrophota bacterium]